MSPFIDHCALPELPGREPFGGKILSHDFVEAALMRRAGYEVWLAGEYEGSYEEGPQDLVEHAIRDRRWCQGNLQHIWLLFSRGLMPLSRIHLAHGIMGYCSSLFWLLFLVLGGILAYNQKRSGLTLLPDSGFTNFWELSISQHSALIVLATGILLFLPKVLGLLDAWIDPIRASQFGGRFRIFASVFLETFVSTLIAPIFMIYHSGFVISTMMGKGVSWIPQNRDAGEGIPFIHAFKAHKYHVLAGVLALYLSQSVSMVFSLWMSPIWISLVLSPFISSLLSKPVMGTFLKVQGFFTIPEERKEPRLLSQMRVAQKDFSELREFSSSYSSFVRAAVDPFVNAVRVAMGRKSKKIEPMIPEVINRALKLGPSSLDLKDRRRILESPDGLLNLYDRIWQDDPDSLHESWSKAIRSFS